MNHESRGTITRITIELEYPDGDRHTRVIDGDTLDHLVLIAVTEQAIQEHLGTIKHQDKALRTFRQGFKEPGRGKPVMLLLYADGSYDMECDRESHQLEQRS